jgi:hypothetical protein
MGTAVRKEFIILPAFGKIAGLSVVSFMVVWIFFVLPKLNVLMYVSYGLACCSFYYAALFASALLKIDGDVIYIFRIYKWEKIDVGRIKYAIFKPPSVLRIAIPGINLAGMVYVGILGGEGWEVTAYINTLVEDRAKKMNESGAEQPSLSQPVPAQLEPFPPALSKSPQHAVMVPPKISLPPQLAVKLFSCVASFIFLPVGLFLIYMYGQWFGAGQGDPIRKYLMIFLVVLPFVFFIVSLLYSVFVINPIKITDGEIYVLKFFRFKRIGRDEIIGLKLTGRKEVMLKLKDGGIYPYIRVPLAGAKGWELYRYLQYFLSMENRGQV